MNAKCIECGAPHDNDSWRCPDCRQRFIERACDRMTEPKTSKAQHWVALARADLPNHNYEPGERAIVAHFLWVLEAALERWNRGK
jgi:DNA-directed RNA polymerase subunit RPC12/RpoP